MTNVLTTSEGELSKVRYKQCLARLKLGEVQTVVNKAFRLLFMIWNGAHNIANNQPSKSVMFAAIADKWKK